MSQNTSSAPETWCKTCRFWDGDDEGLEGDCRRHAPRLSGQAVPGGSATHQDPMFRAWPITRIDDWCGEHQHKEDL